VPQFAVGPDAEDNRVSSEVNVEIWRGEDVGIVKGGKEFVNGGQRETLVA